MEQGLHHGVAAVLEVELAALLIDDFVGPIDLLMVQKGQIVQFLGFMIRRNHLRRRIPIAQGIENLETIAILFDGIEKGLGLILVACQSIGSRKRRTVDDKGRRDKLLT